MSRARSRALGIALLLGLALLLGACDHPSVLPSPPASWDSATWDTSAWQ